MRTDWTIADDAYEPSDEACERGADIDRILLVILSCWVSGEFSRRTRGTPSGIGLR